MYLVDLCEYWNIGIDTYFMMICKELAKLYKFLFFIKTNCGHLGFLPVISVFQNIWLGTVAVFDPYTFSLLCANFHAFNTKPTFFSQICWTIKFLLTYRSHHGIIVWNVYECIKVLMWMKVSTIPGHIFACKRGQ